MDFIGEQYMRLETLIPSSKDRSDLRGRSHCGLGKFLVAFAGCSGPERPGEACRTGIHCTKPATLGSQNDLNEVLKKRLSLHWLRNYVIEAMLSEKKFLLVFPSHRLKKRGIELKKLSGVRQKTMVIIGHSSLSATLHKVHRKRPKAQEGRTLRRYRRRTEGGTPFRKASKLQAFGDQRGISSFSPTRNNPTKMYHCFSKVL